MDNTHAVLLQWLLQKCWWQRDSETLHTQAPSNTARAYMDRTVDDPTLQSSTKKYNGLRIIHLRAGIATYVRRLGSRHFIMASNHGEPQKHHLVGNCCKHQWYRMDVKELGLVFHNMQPFCGAYKSRGYLDVQICRICFVSCRGGDNKVQSGLYNYVERPLPTHIPCVNLWDNYILHSQDTKTKGKPPYI